MAWAGGRIYYESKNPATGLFDGWSATPDGSGASCLTCIAAFPATTQHGVGDVTPDGRYALVTVERSGHWPVADGAGSASPGQGAYNDLWLEATDGSAAWKLVDLTKTGTSALIWPRFDPTGTRVVWAEQTTCCVSSFGYWTMHVANLTWTNGVPSLTSEKTYAPAGVSNPSQRFLEPYGFSPDGSKVIFASDAWTGGQSDQWDLQIVTMSSSLTGNVTRLSPHDQWCDCLFTNYNEFAFYMPSGRIMFGRDVGAYHGSIEYWTMNPDGSNPVQLTHLSAPPATGLTILGGAAFNPQNPNQFVAGVQTDYNGDSYTVLITLG